MGPAPDEIPRENVESPSFVFANSRLLRFNPARMQTRLFRSLGGHVLLNLIAILLAVVNPPVSAADNGDGLPYVQKKDVIYGEVHGVGLLMDVFVPKGKPNGLAIVDVASGAWHSDRSKIRDHTLAQIFQIHCSRGYVVFAVRPGSRTHFTVEDMVKHLKMGIRHIKEQAGEYRIDPNRLGMTGASAGGHLALLAALGIEQGRPDARNAAQRLDTGVKAVAVFFPPTDFVDWKGDGKMASPELLGGLIFPGGVQGRSEEEIMAQARKISPLRNATRIPLPMLLFHGDADPLVPLNHSQRFVAAMKEAGNTIELIVKPGGGHPWLTLPEEVRLMADWFDKQLGSPASGAAPAPTSTSNSSTDSK